MSERPQWAPPSETTEPTQSSTYEQRLEAAYADDLAQDADIDNMKAIGRVEAPQMIEVPNWSHVPEDGSESVRPALNDPLAIGREINIIRNGKNGNPDYEDGGWKIIKNDAEVTSDEQLKAAVIVSKIIDGEEYIKRVPSERVLALNPEEGEVYVPMNLAERMGGTAIDAVAAAEAADDSIDEDQKFFKPSEIKAMREAAAQRSDTEPDAAIPNLNQMMSGEPNVVEAAEAVNPLIELTKGLSSDDLLELRSYAEASIGKRQAQKDGDGQRSTLEGQYMGQALRAMSHSAQAIAGQYLALYERS